MPNVDTGVQPGIEASRAPSLTAATLDPKKLPGNFPLLQWVEQEDRYRNYWDWFTGVKLADAREVETTGDVLYKFPLHINTIRTFARKHAAVLFGEVHDTPDPLVKARVTARAPLDPDEQVPEADDKLARFAQNIINEVWMNSNGRAIQMENGTLSQFLGGCVFQVVWSPQRKDLRVPITIRPIMPDFFMPIWDTENYWNLLEAFVIYRIPATVAARQYGIGDDSTIAYVNYVEHWTRDTFSILIDNVPVKALYDGEIEEELRDVKHGFGFVPFLYIPHLREGGFYGSSIVDDLVGLIREYNSRMADMGDAIMKTVHRKRYMSNNYQDIVHREIAPGVEVIDLGIEPATVKNPPKVWTEDPINISAGVSGYNEAIFDEMLRNGSLGTIAFGEDEGSQRSGLTLELRMWPITSHARAERSFWDPGLNAIGNMILKMVAVKQPNGLKLDEDYEHRIQVSQDWSSMVPRGRRELVEEITMLVPADARSPQTAIDQLGDVRNTDEELKNIQDWLTFKASLTKQPENSGDDSDKKEDADSKSKPNEKEEQ